MGSSYRRGPDPLEQGLDRLVSAGRQLVDGVSGARPGSRPPARGAARRSPSLPRLDGLGRWVEDKLDWILEDEDDWREPWQEQRAAARTDADQPGTSTAPEPPPRPRRRPLEAISRRGSAPAAPAADWPGDDAFSLPRWQRAAQPERLETGRQDSNGRPLPRSSRRRGR